ncbi:hypothetical protein U0070_022935 [Myodes glareolus]|uniref:Uncharacterized protein n=1 Tax=Myodes glareolus TaxID=447135 RepID=A0AAW0ICN9_MYOGA
MGILASICGGLVMLLPETKGIALPETVDDVEKLGRYYLTVASVWQEKENPGFQFQCLRPLHHLEG